MAKKKISSNPKAEEARQKKQEAKEVKNAKAVKAKEDAYWSQHANPVAKRDLKRAEEERKKEEAQKKKQEAKLLAQKEAEELAKVGKKKQVVKITKREIEQVKEKQKAMYEEIASDKEKERMKTVGVDEYASLLDVKVDNKTEAVVDARSLDAAVSQMNLAEDRHPEKRTKALFNQYFERRLPEMKEEKPGLKLMQYKARIFDEWQKHPDNPRNQMKFSN